MSPIKDQRVGDLLAVDFRAKKYLGKVPTVEEGMEIIRQAMPKSIDDIPWEPPSFFLSDKDPA